LPKGLYGRSALILIVPIVVIQLLVSLMFIQRHFDGVTEQMTHNIASELTYLRAEINAAAPSEVRTRIAEIAEPLGLEIEPIEHLGTGVSMMFYDLPGTSIDRTLRQRLDGIGHIDLRTNEFRVALEMDTLKGPYKVAFGRSRVSASNPHQLLVLMLVVTILMTLIAILFLRNQVRPIRRLARAAEAFGRGQSVPFKVAGASEVRQAGQAFIDMRDRLERQIEQRTMMLSGVSHDLRTPLTRLKLGLSLSSDTENAAELIRDVDDMEQMLEEFLAFARGDSTDEMGLVNPVDLVQLVVDDVARSGGQIEFILPENPDPPLQQPMRIAAFRRALENLVTNALRYGTRCRVTLLLADGVVRYIVEDDGPGIPASQRERAVRPFVRLDKARNQDRGTGVGLGLAISMDIASSHGGALILEDSAALGGLWAELQMPL